MGVARGSVRDRGRGVAQRAGHRAGGAGHHAQPTRLALISVSNPRPELVSGGEVLVRVTVPRGIPGWDVRVTADGTNVSGDFKAQPDGSLLGLVTGLRVGRNELTARGQRASGPSTLAVTDHPITGPVFSGQASSSRTSARQPRSGWRPPSSRTAAHRLW